MIVVLVFVGCDQLYQVVDGLPAKSADQMDGQLDKEDDQDERGHAGCRGGMSEVRASCLPNVFDC